MFSKIPLFSLLIWVTTIYSQHQKKINRIDSLQTAEEIQKFIDEKELDYTIMVSEKIKYDSYCSSIADSLNIKPWGKGDFDNNGLTDLLVTGNSKEGTKTICILDQGDRFEKVNVSLGNLYEACAFATARDNKVVYQRIKILDRSGQRSSLLTENLIYKFDRFIEENALPKKHHILEIQFNTSPCYGRCPAFSLKIVSNRDVEWIAKNYNKVNFQEYTGEYESKIPPEQYKELINLLNYIDFENLDDNYEASYTDFATGTLKIVYDNLKVKTIRDDGMMGSRGLQMLYKILFDLRGNLEWKR